MKNLKYFSADSPTCFTIIQNYIHKQLHPCIRLLDSSQSVLCPSWWDYPNCGWLQGSKQRIMFPITAKISHSLIPFNPTTTRRDTKRGGNNCLCPITVELTSMYVKYWLKCHLLKALSQTKSHKLIYITDLFLKTWCRYNNFACYTCIERNWRSSLKSSFSIWEPSEKNAQTMQ